MDARMKAGLEGTMAKLREEIEAKYAVLMEYEKRPLCTVACDWLFGLRQHWDKETSEKILAGFEKCDSGNSDKCVAGTNIVDLRGCFMEEAIEKLIKHLEHYSPLAPQGTLNITVGCKMHGLGKGKLKRAMTALLKSDKSIEINRAEDDPEFIISVKLDGRDDYNSLRRVSLMRFLPPSDDDDSDVADLESGMEEDEEGFLYTITCDLQFGPPKQADQSQDEKMSGKVLSEFDELRKNRVKLRSKSVDEILRLLDFHLDRWSSPLASDFIMSCELHGFGEGKLSQKVIGLLGRGGKFECSVRHRGGVFIILHFNRRMGLELD